MVRPERVARWTWRREKVTSLARLRELATEDLARTVAQCTDGEHAGWISPVLEINGSVPCFAHSTNRTFTYLSVSEPFGFYLDGIAAAFCLVLGITVAYELIRGRPWEDTYETYESDRRPFSTAEALFAMH